MKVLNDIIKKCEDIHKERNNYFSVIALISRLYTRFLETGVFGYADNAFFISVKSFKNCTQNIVYSLAAAFFEMETGRYNAAYKRIQVCDNYKGYLKNSQPSIYAFYLYINALVMFRQKNTRTSLKIYREMVGLWEQNNKEYSILLLLAGIDVEYDNFGSAKKRLEYYIKIGKGNYFFYICLFKYLNSKNKSIYCTPRLILPFLKWGISHGIDLRNIVNVYSGKICTLFKENKELVFKLYYLYENEELLKEICMNFIEKNDFSTEAFKYCNLAVKKQIFIPGLNNFFVRSSFYNDNTDFGIYPVKTFFKYGDMKDDIKPFMYYLVISNKKFKELLNDKFYDIITFGIDSAKKGMSGKYYDNIYRYIIENKHKFDFEIDYIEKMKEIIFPKLFLNIVESKNPNSKYCFVFEKNKEKAEIYSFQNGTCEIKLISVSAEYFISDEKKQFIDADIIIKKYIENINLSLCREFYLSGYVSEELDMALANYYINVEYPNYDCIEIYERVLKIDISKKFRSKVLITMGNLHYFNREFDKALNCFLDIDIKYIKNKHIQNLFDVFVEKENFDDAAKLIIERGHCIPDNILFDGIRKIIKKEHLKPILAKCVYELVLKSKYDRYMIEVLTEHYKGGRRDWLLISNVLYNMGVPNKSIDEKLIKMSVQTRVFDKEVQFVFSSIYKNDKENELINEFAEYCCYEMIINFIKPENETIIILEELFLSNGNEMISYALSHIYLIYDVQTENRNYIINAALKNMKSRNLVFPVFKENKYKFKDDLFIQKNYPFIYYASSDKSVLFYFREKGEFDFHSKAMRYLDFGIYYINVPIFFGEEIEYYICENKEKGSIETQKQVISNKDFDLQENSKDDPFFDINNSIIYESMHKYEESENIINKKIRKNNKLRCNIL